MFCRHYISKSVDISVVCYSQYVKYIMHFFLFVMVFVSTFVMSNASWQFFNVRMEKTFLKNQDWIYIYTVLLFSHIFQVDL